MEIIITLSIVLVVSILLNINLLRKLETTEDYISDLEDSNSNFDSFFSELKTQVNKTNSHMKQIDRLGSFESDDETGYVFKELKNIEEKLNKRF